MAFAVVWQGLAALALTMVVSLRLGRVPWALDSIELRMAAVLVIGHAMASLALRWIRRFRGRVGIVDVLLALLAGFCGPLLIVFVAETRMSRTVMVMGFAASGCLLAVPHLRARLRRASAAFVAIAIAGAFAAAGSGAVLRPTAARGMESRRVLSSLYALRVDAYRGFVPPSATFRAGGGIAGLSDGYLLVTGDGDLYHVRIEDRRLTARRLPIRVPLDRPTFRAGSGPGLFTDHFRAMDVVVRVGETTLEAFVSHHVWDPVNRCVQLVVSGVTGSSASLDRIFEGAEWHEVHRTEPCLPLDDERPSWPFRGQEGGGQMAFLDPTSLLVTVGDHGFNGVDIEADLVQSPDASYGKTVRVDLSTGSWDVFTTGHRNAQGIFVDDVGTVWQSEHGPQGGDEINILSAGENYGWPVVTHGTTYGGHAWPRNTRQGRHDAYRSPAYAWVPSVAPSGLARVEGPLFSQWQGDLLVGSMVGGKLWRLVIEGDRVVLAEPIDIGEQIRDVVEDGSGRLVLWTDAYSIVTVDPADLEFAACSGCHWVDDGRSHGLGPDLQGIVGRPVAPENGFRYSPALRDVGGEWTPDRLDRFLASPQSFAPGTTMQMQGIEDAEVRRAIIEQLGGRE